jgi:hypothetical protein
MNQIFPGLQAEYQNQYIFRKWDDPLMSIFWIVPFINAFVALYVWSICKRVLKGDTYVSRGFYFAFLYWLVTIPGMVISYSSFQISEAMVISWTAGNLLQALFTGLIYARLFP